jgi:hypothetical protein
VDLWAVAGALVAVVMTGVYVSIVRQQGEDPAAWFLAAVGLGALAAGYGAAVPAPHRRTALAVAVTLLVACGLLAILTIGLPILLAGALVLVAFVRAASATRPHVDAPH